MENIKNVNIHQNDWNIDRSLIFIIPLIFLSVLIWMPEEWIFESSLLCLAVPVYVLLTYKHRLVYGFSGIRIASIPSIIITTFTVFIAIPSIYILAINEHPSEIPYFFSIAMFYLLFPAGLFFGNKYRKIDTPSVVELLTQTYNKDRFDKYFFCNDFLTTICIVSNIFLSKFPRKYSMKLFFPILTNCFGLLFFAFVNLFPEPPASNISAFFINLFYY